MSTCTAWQWEAHCAELEGELDELRKDRTDREIAENRRLDEQMRLTSAVRIKAFTYAAARDGENGHRI
jgi:hypothetical protein